MDRHAVSPFNLSQALLVGGGSLVLYSLSESPVIKQLMQMVTMVPGRVGGFNQCASPNKITGGGDCSHEIKRHLLLERKAITYLDSILKSRDIANKGPSSQGYGFSSSHVWM